jgi:hypothetical protein
MDYGRPY